MQQSWRRPILYIPSVLLIAQVDTTKFPHGLMPVADAAHSQPGAVQFIVWFEPERVGPGTYLSPANKSSSAFANFTIHAGAQEGASLLCDCVTWMLCHACCMR